MRKYKPVELDTELKGNGYINQINDNQKQLNEIDKEAKDKGELLGRYIDEPFADGKAIYQITKVGKKKVNIEVCTQLGDDWQIPYWGPEATIERSYAEGSVRRRDGMNALFADAVGKKAEPERPGDPKL